MRCHDPENRLFSRTFRICERCEYVTSASYMILTPPSPALSPDLTPPLGLDEVAILLDVDGTIIDIAPTPREVWVPPVLCATLSTLLERTGGALALVSGRSVADLDLLFAPLQLPMIGGHGAEVRLSPDEEGNEQRTARLPDTIKRKFAAIKSVGPGVLV